MATNFSPVLGVLCFKPIPKYCNVWYVGILCISQWSDTGPSCFFNTTNFPKLQELVREKHALQTQVNENLVQISALRNKLDEMRHRKDLSDPSDLSRRLDMEREKSEEKDKQVNSILILLLINPFPKKSWFLHVCSTSLLKTLWEKEKLLVGV